MAGAGVHPSTSSGEGNWAGMTRDPSASWLSNSSPSHSCSAAALLKRLGLAPNRPGTSQDAFAKV